MSTVERIGTDEVNRRRQKGTIDHFWNVLSDDYFTGEMIPGSRRVPVGRVGREVRERELDRDATIVVYCSGPDCPQSTAAAEKLVDLGFRNVAEYEEGLPAWKEAGLPIEETPVDATAA